MANTGFPQANGGFPQVPQQGFPQAAQSSNSPYGFAQQSNNAGQNSDEQWGTQQDEQWGSTVQGAQDSTEQSSQGFANTTNTAPPTQAGYSQRKPLFPQDDQAATVLPPMQQMVNTSNVGYWSANNQQQPVAYQPTTYQADLPVKPKEGILYKNTGRKLEEIPDPTPIILDTTGGKMMLTLDTVSIYRLGDAAKRHKNYYVELPLKSLSSASVVSDTDKDGNVTSAICLDVVTVEGHNRVPATTAEALKDVWSFEVGNLAEAQSFCDKVNSCINNERFPVRDMPHIDEGPRNTAIAAVIAGILAVALAVVCFTGHPYSKASYELSPAEMSRIHQEAVDKAQKEAEEKVADDQAKKQEEQQKKDQEAQQQQTQQQNAERDAAKQTAQRILATDTPSKQGLINKMVAQGITQDLAQSTADGLTDVNWSNNATDLARKYLQAHPDWTANQLSSQLVNNDLFTQDEANAATSALAGDIAKNQSNMQNGTQSNGQNNGQNGAQSGNGDSNKGTDKRILDGITNWLGGSDNK